MCPSFAVASQRREEAADLSASIFYEVAGVQWRRGRSMSATMADCEAAQTRQSNEGGGGLRMPSDAFRRAKRRWWGVCGMLVMSPSAGLWECSVVWAAAAVHLWGAGGSALSLEGHWRRLPTRGRPHWSRAFKNAGNGTGASRGGGGAKRCDATTSWREQRGGVEDGCVRRLPEKM